MAAYGEWNQKGTTLSHVKAAKEYGVSLDFIVQGIRADKLEYRDGAVFGSSYLKVLRSQLEQYITEELGSQYLGAKKAQAELSKIKKEMADLKKKLAALEVRKAEIEAAKLLKAVNNS